MNGIKITVIDYGMGNLWSVLSALRYLNCSPVVTNDPREVAEADSLLLPGVGSFRKAMLALRALGLDEAIVKAVTVKSRKILGICLGMQLMGTRSSEDGETAGLGLINACVDKFSELEIGANKIPHIGFDLVHSDTNSRLFQKLQRSADFYFVHSYRMLPTDIVSGVAICQYGVDFMAAYENENIFATQFHPEKSQTNGLQLLKNYISL